MAVTSIPKRLVGCDLINLAAAQGAAFAALCEEQYAARVEQAAQKVLTAGCPVVMLTGPSSSGKTTSANKLAAAIARRGTTCDVISLDDFFVGEGRYPKRADGTDDYECLEALDIPGIHSCLDGLTGGGVCRVPRFDFASQRPSGEYRTVNSGGVVIIEGLHAFNPALTNHLPKGSVYRIYAGLREEYCNAAGARSLCTRDVRLARRLVRDCLFRNHTADFTLELWPHVCAAENEFIKPFKKYADFVLDTSFSYEVCLWEKLIAPMAGSLGGDVASAQSLELLCRKFEPFRPLDEPLVPQNSMLREFVGQN